MNITIFNEGRDERRKPEVLEVYPNGIGGVLRDIVLEMEETNLLTIGCLYDEECGLTEDILEKTDVLIYWSHGGNHEFPDEIAKRVQNHVLRGMGFIVLHSAIGCKAFTSLMGTTCTFRYHHDDKEHVICCNPTHPIAQGVDDRFVLEVEETYGEFMDIPKPDDIIFIGWFSSGEVCRSGCTFTRGNGKIFFFQPGHETNPSFYHPQVRKIIQNACHWATPTRKLPKVSEYVAL
ncbi:ThuA domain-containing protein [Lachnoclostridium phytofermentans]|jgi:trehalose utilization protein|uniref:ThuA domain-containing protein n=1 Tax=Lachnoclostridium phytofermentans TaxID=66219 RepID=UPI000494EF82|nr:ThuA domain-containing protein [Lachnoclostridium phytofermentans]